MLLLLLATLCPSGHPLSAVGDICGKFGKFRGRWRERGIGEGEALGRS